MTIGYFARHGRSTTLAFQDERLVFWLIALRPLFFVLGCQSDPQMDSPHWGMLNGLDELTIGCWYKIPSGFHFAATLQVAGAKPTGVLIFFGIIMFCIRILSLLKYRLPAGE